MDRVWTLDIDKLECYEYSDSLKDVEQDGSWEKWLEETNKGGGGPMVLLELLWCDLACIIYWVETKYEKF